MPMRDCNIDPTVKIWQPEQVNLYECTIGPGCNIAAFVEIGRGVTVGRNCRVEAFCFIPEGVTIGNNVFIGPGVMFANDKHPPSGRDTWSAYKTIVKDGAKIGLGARILPGITIGRGAMIGAGAVVTRDVPDGETWVGLPAKEHNRDRL